MTSSVSPIDDSSKKKQWSRPLKSLGEYLGKKREDRRVRNSHGVVEGASVSNHDPGSIEDINPQYEKVSVGSKPQPQEHPESPVRRRGQLLLGRIKNMHAQTKSHLKRGQPSPSAALGESTAPNSPLSSPSPRQQPPLVELSPTLNRQTQRPSLLRPPSQANVMEELSPEHKGPILALPSQPMTPRSPNGIQHDVNKRSVISSESNIRLPSPCSLQSKFGGDESLSGGLPSRERKTMKDLDDDVSEEASLGSFAERYQSSNRPSLDSKMLVLVDDQHRSFATVNTSYISTRKNSYRRQKMMMLGHSVHASHVTIKMSNISKQNLDYHHAENSRLHKTPRRSPSNVSTQEDFRRRTPERTKSESSSSSRSSKKSPGRPRRNSRSRSRSQDKPNVTHRRRHDEHSHDDLSSSVSETEESLHNMSNRASTYCAADKIAESPRGDSSVVSWKEAIAMQEGIPVGLPVMGRQSSSLKHHESKNRSRSRDGEREPRGRDECRSDSKERKGRSLSRGKKCEPASHRFSDCTHAKATIDKTWSTPERSKSDNDATKTKHNKATVTKGSMKANNTDRLLYTSPKLMKSTYKSPLERSYDHRQMSPTTPVNTSRRRESVVNSNTAQNRRSIDRHISESPGWRSRRSIAVAMDGSVVSHRTSSTRESSCTRSHRSPSRYIMSPSREDRQRIPLTPSKSTRDPYRYNHDSKSSSQDKRSRHHYDDRNYSSTGKSRDQDSYKDQKKVVDSSTSRVRRTKSSDEWIANTSKVDHRIPRSDETKRDAYRIESNRHSDDHYSPNTSPIGSEFPNAERVSRSISPHWTRKSSSKQDTSSSTKESSTDPSSRYKHRPSSSFNSSREQPPKSPGHMYQRQRIAAPPLQVLPEVKDLRKYLSDSKRERDERAGYKNVSREIEASLGEATVES